MSAEHWLDLRCHESSRTDAVCAVRVLVRRLAGAELQLKYRLEGDVPRIRIPSPGPARIAMQLWQHTCFEAFIAVEGQARYHEFNFAPSGEWTVYSLRGYRDGEPVADEAMRPDIEVQSVSSRLELKATVRLDRLSAGHARASLRVGLTAVIEASDGVSYWALKHPRDKPDFHDAKGFTLLLEPPV